MPNALPLFRIVVPLHPQTRGRRLFRGGSSLDALLSGAKFFERFT